MVNVEYPQYYPSGWVSNQRTLVAALQDGRRKITP